MNIYEKLQNCRVDLLNSNIKMTGKNKFSGYSYYSLKDILPAINQLFNKYKLCSYISYTNEEATLTITNSENIEEFIMFTSPYAEASLKGCHPIQNLGAIETYQRRYLYMTALEIVEFDTLDATINVKTALEREESIKELKQLLEEKGYTVEAIVRKYNKNNLNSLKDEEIDQVITGLKKLGAKNG